MCRLVSTDTSLQEHKTSHPAPSCTSVLWKRFYIKSAGSINFKYSLIRTIIVSSEPKALCDKNSLVLTRIPNRLANNLVVQYHYLHRPVYIGRNISYGVTYKDKEGLGVVMFGYPIFREKENLVGEDAPLQNGELVDMVRVWLPDSFPSGSESCTIGKGIRLLKQDWPMLTGKEAKAVITFADAEFMHYGTVYKASNFILMGYVKGRKAIAGSGHGRWGVAQRAGIGQTAGTKKYVFLYIIDKEKVDVNALRKTYMQDEKTILN